MPLCTDEQPVHSIEPSVVSDCAQAESTEITPVRPIHGGARRPSNGLIVFPRRKSTKSGIQVVSSDMLGLSHPVVITQELLLSLASLSLCRASGVLGISITALKRACRKFGLSRWPRKYERLGCSHESSSSPSQQQTFALQPVENLTFESTNMTEATWSAPYPQSGPQIYCGTDDPRDLQGQWAHIPSLNGPLEHTRPTDFPSPQKSNYVCPWSFSLAHFGDGLSMEVPIIDLPELF
jgi:hypothetical protein